MINNIEIKVNEKRIICATRAPLLQLLFNGFIDENEADIMKKSNSYMNRRAQTKSASYKIRSIH